MAFEDNRLYCAIVVEATLHLATIIIIISTHNFTKTPAYTMEFKCRLKHHSFNLIMSLCEKDFIIMF